MTLATTPLGFTSKQNIHTVNVFDFAREFGEALINTADEYWQHRLCIKLPDGSIVTGYAVEAETLTDGSLVFNLILRA